MPGTDPGRGRRFFLRLPGAVVASILLLCSLLPATAFAMTDAKFVVDQETGGQPTRFTYTARTDGDARVSTMAFTFPKGFDLAKSTTKVVTLQGLTRIPASVKQKIDGQRLELAFTPSIEASSSMLLMVYDVMTPIQGGTYAIDTSYDAGGQVRATAPLEFKYKTPPRSEALSRWLDMQPLVGRWNNVKFLNLFLKPQLISIAIPILAIGWLMSIALVGIGFPVAIVGGLLLAFMKMAKVPPVRWVASAYINVIRGTPLFLQIFIAFIGLPIAGIHLHWFLTGVIVLALNSSAYLAEIFRAGIQSINRGQFEAASSLGMTYAQAMRFVIIPQTVKRVLPTMTSEFILLFKDTALLSAVGVFDLMMYSSNIVARTGNLTPFMVAAVYYLLVTIPLINWVASLEVKLAISEGGQVAQPAKRRSVWDLLALRRRATGLVEPLPVEPAEAAASAEDRG